MSELDTLLRHLAIQTLHDIEFNLDDAGYAESQKLAGEQDMELLAKLDALRDKVDAAGKAYWSRSRNGVAA